MIRTIGFVGAGTMGEPMAANLLRGGFDVYMVPHRNREPIERLVRAGATEVGSLAELLGTVEVLVTCAPNDVVVREVMLGSGGVLSSGRPGLIVVDTSTISPTTSQQVAAALAEKGISMLDAPISGGQSGAIAGTLAIMVGGSRDSFDAVLPVLQAMGQNITYVGDNGSALVVKLANNLIAAATMAAVAEALAMAAKAGVDPGLVQQVLSKATARGWIIEEKLPRSVLMGDLRPGFKLSLMQKDMGLAQDYGKTMGVPMFVSGLVYQLYTQALGLGKGDLDSMGICELYSEAAGVSLEKRS